MSVSDDTPICIPSDDDDSDVEIVKEEKVDLDDGDVIFVSQTSPKISTIEDVSSSGQSEMQVGTSVQDGKLNMKSQTVIPCHRSESISSDLEMTLSLQEVGAPLDLSSRKLDDESDDSLDGSSCESTCTSFSSSDESVLNIPNDQVDLKTDSNLPCLKSTSQFNVCDNNILTLQTADNSKSKAVTSCTPFQSSFDEYISSSLDMTYMPAADMKPIFPTMCKIEPQDKSSCKSQYTCKINSSRPNLHSSTDTPGPVTFSTLPQKCNTHGDSTSNSILGTHAQGMDTAGISTVGTHVSETDTLGTQSSSSTDSMMHCSAPKKKKENASDSDDIWASLKKDLDFLSNLNDEILTVNSSVTTTKCLSNSESNGASNSSKSFPDMSNFQTSSDLKTSPNQNLVLTGSILPQSQTTGRPTAVIKSVSSFPSLLTSSSSIVCTSAGSSDSKQLPPKKQLRCFPLGKTVSCPNSKSSVSVVETGNKWGSEKCSSCVISLLGLKSSRCLQGHVTCGACLEERVKLVLTGKSKESLRCVQTNCDSYYPMSELKHSLPSMVVEILEDKLDNDYIEYISNMIMKNACPSATGQSGSQDKATESQGSLEDLNSETSTKQEGNSAGFCTDNSNSKQQIPEDWPSTWCKMENRAGFILVPLKPESPEYIDVAVKFHSTLTFPAADILKISRVQNPILWKYHCVKRLEMIHDNDGLAVEERHLYHGTTASVVDAICRKGFDWRVCGKHGTVYGQGTYFAADASYSHQYTDKGNDKVFYRLSNLSRRIHGGRSLVRPRPSPLLIPPPAHAGANLSNLIMNPAPAAAGFLSMQFGSSLTSQGQGQNQGQGQGQSQNLVTNIQNVSSSNINSQVISNNNINSLCGSNSNMSVSNNLPAQTNNNLIGSLSQTNSNLIGSYQVHFNQAVPPPAPATVSHAVNNAMPSSSFLFGAPRKRLLGLSSNSSQEEPRDSQPVHKMFMSKVLVGKYTGGHAGLRKPPPLFPDSDPYGKCYDSCVDNILNPKIFVIFDSTQAYPDYLIEYQFTG